MRSRNRTVDRRRGFTLLEVVVALALSGVVLLGARLILEGLADDAGRIARHAAAADRDANGERLLRGLVDRIEVATDTGGQFGGDERTARFTTWCDVPAGWQERCAVTLAVDTLGGAPVLVARLATAEGTEVVPLRAGFAQGTLRYLAEAGSGGTWFRVWGTGITAPVAIGVILDADTLIVRIGERG